MLIPSACSAKIYFLLTLVFFSSAGFAQYDDIRKAPAPDWVFNIKVEKPLAIPIDEIKGGIYYLLGDRQLKVTDTDKQVSYHQFADYIVNSHGLESSSQLNISFDPGYQSLTFHSLRLIRDGKVIDKLHTAKYSLLQREQALEKLIYDGRLSANVILDDVRVGDIVNYSYSIEGTNPVYRGNFSYSFYTQWSVPLKRQFIRILWEKTKPLKITQLNQVLEPASKPYAGGIEYVFETHDPAPLTMNTQVPAWYDPYARVILTDSESWQDIVAWALPLYTSASVPNNEVVKIAQQIRTRHKTLDAQIHAALAFVQSNIRYLGLEMGENSHQPSPAAETLDRRYGDCKDKTVLLIALLKALDVTAHPALVNSTLYKEVARFPPSTSAFDHVIVYLKHHGKDIWLDPTRQHQPGSLHTLYQPDFGYALVIAPDSNALTSMAAERQSKQVVNDVFDLHKGIGGKSTYTVTTNYYGHEAERQRHSIANSSNTDKTEQYLNYYKNYFPQITAIAPLNITELNEGAELEVAEYYEIPDIWEKDESGRFTAFFYANSVSSNLVTVEEAKRNSPFYLRYPNHVIQEIKIHLPERAWNLPDEQFDEINSFFEYRSRVRFNKKTRVLTLAYEYRSLADQVPAEKISEYIEARKRADDDTQYEIYNYLEAQETESNLRFYLLIFALVLYLTLLLFVVVNWYRDEQRKMYYSQTIFYPVSLLKLAVLGVLTLGLYQYYWFYRNWSYVKRVYQSRSLPFWRSFFNIFWFYSLSRRIANNDSPGSSRVLPRSPIALVLLAIVYFIASILVNIDFYGPIALLTVLILILWLAHQVNQFIQPELAIYTHHSRWRLRHLLLILLFVPITFFYLGSEARILPSSRVVDGEHLLQRDIKFMQDNNLIPAGEELIYFYSDAHVNIRKDGNGFTKSQVFSYWKDDNDKLNTEIAKLHDIEKIDLSDDVSWGENAGLTIHREDGSNFLLYLSTEKNGHRKFEQKLRLLWQAARLNNEVKLAFGASVLSDAAGKRLQKNVTHIMPLALFKYDSETQRILAELYSRGVVVGKNVKRAMYFYNLAYKQGQKKAGSDLAWHLAVSGKDLERALSISEALLEIEDTSSIREILAATYASMGDFNRAIVEQQRALDSATREQKPEVRRKLETYQKSLPWTQLWPDVEPNASTYFLLKNAAPVYPRTAAEQGVEGNIQFEFDISTNGQLTNVKVLSAEPEGFFEEAGRAALKQFLYLPEIVEGKAVVTQGVKKRFIFELED